MRSIQRATKSHRSQADVQASGQPQRIRLPPTTTTSTTATTTTIPTTKHHTRALKLLTLKLLRRFANDVADIGRRQTCNLTFLPGSLRQHEEGRQGLVGIPGARDGRRVAARTCCTARAVGQALLDTHGKLKEDCGNKFPWFLVRHDNGWLLDTCACRTGTCFGGKHYYDIISRYDTFSSLLLLFTFLLRWYGVAAAYMHLWACDWVCYLGLPDL